MRKNMMAKNLRRTIRDSVGRYLAVVIIIALGSALFVGLLSTKADMVATGQKYMGEQHMFDLRLHSTYGWTQAEVDAVAKLPGVALAEGTVALDVIGHTQQGAKDAVYKVHPIPQQVSQVYLLGGRMPQNPNECLIDGHNVGDEVLGLEFTVSSENASDTLDALIYDTYTAVGYVSSPLYMDMSRGSTSIGNGNVAGYVYLPTEAIELDYYTEIAVCLEGAYTVYTQDYTDVLKDMAERLKPDAALLANDRFADIRAEAEAEYNDGLREYEQGRLDFEHAKADALSSLSDGWQKLEAGRKQIEDNRLQLEEGFSQLLAGQTELENRQASLDALWQTFTAQKDQTFQALEDARAELESNEKAVTESLNQAAAAVQQIDSELQQLAGEIATMLDNLAMLQENIPILQLQLTQAQAQAEDILRQLQAIQQQRPGDTDEIARLEQAYTLAQAQVQTLQSQLQTTEGSIAEMTVGLQQTQNQHDGLFRQKEELTATQGMLQNNLSAIQAGLAELEKSKTQAEQEFSVAEAELRAGQMQLDTAKQQLADTYATLLSGKEELDAAQAQWDAAMAEYVEGKAEAEAELANAEAELAQAAKDLEEAWDTITDMQAAEVYIMDRNTNVGYLALDNNSDIVAGVSKVFPAFFLLVAALVCITTMTRMVEEERTQIGTFQALGYSNHSIVSKYLIYAGSAAIVGCGLGVLLGSVVFPIILWDVYGLLLNLTPRVVLRFNWPLCLAVVGSYTTVVLLVTWYCCRRTLQEVPAELIRPKSPTSGRQIVLERFAFWKQISFLNKVMLRNIFRYRQRMLMMLFGIGGCTALLLTGYGLRDSIVNIVSNQFEQVTTYDLQIYFNEEQDSDAQQAFANTVRDTTEGVFFFYQTGVELDDRKAVSEIYMIAAGEGIRDFIQFRADKEELPLPDVNEVLLSVGVAEKMGIHVGDSVLLRDADRRELDVTVCGIYENQVYNYAIVTPQTLQTQWGSVPGSQMAVLNIRDSADVHQVGADIGSIEGVLNVMVSEDTANQVTSMLEALDTIVVVIVICAGALAITVLYNLTNINITERIREIATIKVLGFRAEESAAYVFKENLLLTAMGMVFGLFLGKALLDFVISQVKIDMIWIKTSIEPVSCVYAVLLTMLSAVIVDFILYFKLEKINMAEALKSVE